MHLLKWCHWWFCYHDYCTKGDLVVALLLSHCETARHTMQGSPYIQNVVLARLAGYADTILRVDMFTNWLQKVFRIVFRLSILIIFVGAPRAAPALADLTFIPSDLLSGCGAMRQQVPGSSSLKLAIVLKLLSFKLECSTPNPYGPPQPAVVIHKALCSPPWRHD